MSPRPRKIFFDDFFKNVTLLGQLEMDYDFKIVENYFVLGRGDTPDAFQSIEPKPLVATKKDSIQSICSARRKKFPKCSKFRTLN